MVGHAASDRNFCASDWAFIGSGEYELSAMDAIDHDRVKLAEHVQCGAFIGLETKVRVLRP
jgi:hypothetical protein